MKKFALLTLAALSLATTACGPRRDYGGTLGNCNAGSGVCHTWSYTATTTADPAADAKAQAKKDCDSDVWTDDTGCSTTGSVGSCAVTTSASLNSETYAMTRTIVFTPPQVTYAAEFICTQMKGTFTAP